MKAPPAEAHICYFWDSIFSKNYYTIDEQRLFSKRFAIFTVDFIFINNENSIWYKIVWKKFSVYQKIIFNTY